MKTKILILAVAALMLLPGCADIKKLGELEVDSLAVENLSTNGLKGVTIQLAAEVDNPGVKVSLSEISGTIEHSGKVLGVVALDPFVLEGKTIKTYHLNIDMTLGENVSIFDLGRFLDKKFLDEMTVDMSADVKIRNGKTRTMKINDLPLKKLIETVK